MNDHAPVVSTRCHVVNGMSLDGDMDDEPMASNWSWSSSESIEVGNNDPLKTMNNASVQFVQSKQLETLFFNIHSKESSKSTAVTVARSETDTTLLDPKCTPTVLCNMLSKQVQVVSINA